MPQIEGSQFLQPYTHKPQVNQALEQNPARPAQNVEAQAEAAQSHQLANTETGMETAKSTDPMRGQQIDTYA